MNVIVALHNVRSVHNVGSIFRTADAAGISKIYCCGITPTPLDRLKNIRSDFAKVALGAERSVPWEAAKDIVPLIKKLKKEDWKIYAVEQAKKSMPYFKVAAAEIRNAKICIVMGNEVAGLPTPILKLADHILEIPMFGKKESLNVAVAFGIIAFNLRFRGGTM